MIKKHIHQIWIGKNKIPTIVLDTIKNNFVNKYPEFDYTLWDENLIEKNKDIFKLYPYYKLCSSYCGIADLLRLDILYNFGGLYIDADTIYTNNTLNFIDYFTTDKEIICSLDPSNNKVFPNGFLGCIVNSEIIGQIINDLIYDFNPYIPSCENTGPNLISKYLNKYINQVHLFPTKLIYPTNWHNNKNFILNDKCVEEIKNKFNYSFFYQIGFSTNKIVFEEDIEKKIVYNCFNDKNSLKQFELMDEYIITPHKKTLDDQIKMIKCSITIKNIKNPIIYIDERYYENILNNYNINNLFDNCDLGIFIHLGSKKYLNSYNIESSINHILSKTNKIKYLLVYNDPYYKVIDINYNLLSLFEKIKIITRNNKKLNSYFTR